MVDIAATELTEAERLNGDVATLALSSAASMVSAVILDDGIDKADGDATALRLNTSLFTVELASR